MGNQLNFLSANRMFVAGLESHTYMFAFINFAYVPSETQGIGDKICWLLGGSVL